MVSADMELELRLQLKEAGRLLSDPPASIDDLLHILDQLQKLLQMVDQSPNDLMKEALSPSTQALIHGNLLEHPSMDVKVSVAACVCDLTRITAPDPPYPDEQMKGVFRCIVSSLENLSDVSNRSYAKRVAILDIVAKVRVCVVMLDIECEDLVVVLFEYLLNSVRDHHHASVFSLMVKGMAVVLEECEDVSLDIIRTLLASVKNNTGVLPVARKLGEEVFKRSAVKLRPYINQTVAMLGDSLVDYSPLLTSICEGTTDFFEHKDENASVQSNVVNSAPSTVSLDDATQVIKDKEMVTEHAGDVADTNSKKEEGADDHPGSNLTSKLDTNDSVAENSGNVGSKPDTTESVKPVVSETVHGENVTEKGPEIVVAVHKPLESEVTNAASQSGSQQEESQSNIQIKVTNAPSQSGSQQEESQTKIQIKKGIRSTKKGSSQRGPPSTLPVLTTVNEGTVDQEMKSPKRARKKTKKAEENKPSVTTGSDVEPVKSPGSKPVKRSRKKAAGEGSVAKKPKLSGKKTSKKDDKQVVVAGDSEVKPAKRPVRKDNETDSDAKPLKQSVKKRPRSKVITKPREDVANKNEETDSDNTPLKQSVKTGQKIKEIPNPSEDVANNDEETESDNTPLKQSVKKGQKSKVIITKPSEDVANNDEETESDNTPLKQSENKVKEIDSDNKPVNLSENKDDEETDSDNTPLKLTAKRVNKSGSSVVKSSSKNKDGKKPRSGKNVKRKNQTKSVSEDDDGMDVCLKSVLKKAAKGKGKVNSEGALLAGTKRKRSVTEKNATKTIKYNASLVGQKVKVWWPEDKMYYEGIVESFESAENKHKVLYLDGDVETLNLKKEEWEIIEEYSTPIEEAAVAVEAQNTDITPEIAGSLEGEGKLNTKEFESKASKVNAKEDEKEQTLKKMVYSRGKKGSKSKTKSGDENVKESEGVDAVEEPENEKEKSTESQQIGSKSGEEKHIMN